jgi:predicted RNase H-like nuclease (RuvC/YqgF family)
MIVMGVDPGETTGCVVVDSETKEILFEEEIELWHGLAEIIQKFSPEAVVVEDFRLYPTHAKSLIGSDFPASRVIGVLEYLVETHGIKLEKQMASSIFVARKTFLKDAGSGPHTGDALAHALFYIKKSPS